MTQNPFTTLHGKHFDVAIVGGGINGAAAARELSAAGYSVLLAEQADFASGASGRSSRLLHCGLRHLASGASAREILLRPDRLLRSLLTAREDMLARDELVQGIPGRLRAIHFCLPIYHGDAYGPRQLDLAFAALRLLSPRGVALDYRRHHPTELQAVPIAPWLRDPDRLRSVAVFREYLFDWPERIVLDAVFDAACQGAEVHNYLRVESMQRVDTENRWRLSLYPTFDGCSTGADRAQVSADIVLNLAGAWVDRINSAIDAGINPRCAPIKGIHIAVSLPPEFDGWGLFAFNSIGEPLYCLPSNDVHYIGLTRRPFSGDVGAVTAEDDEIDWMIAETDRCLPRLKLERADVLYSWAGVNPLSLDLQNPLGSREIRIHDLTRDGLPGMLTLTGGPITTHRRVAKRLLRAVARRLRPASTIRAPLNQPQHVSDGVSLTGNGIDISQAEVERCAREEKPASLADLMLRRLGAGWYGDQGLALAHEIAKIAASEMGWSSKDIEAELLAYRHYLQTERRQPGHSPDE